MYLKAIDIYGFKSFANKIRLPLKPGITCIVGPNGCGKTNVVDSLKWCIGEMSWKSLRMPSMMDVIFAGTTRRQPLNMAEVAMTFDNESRKLPLDFGEVTVTRKIYRSEESEYFINKVQCRLKDIREMFLDTGIGSGGYAIIDQGEVEYVLNATPEERRELFEEAAGVSKYKSKREEALRRLEKVDADLARLADSMVLIDEQIKKLELEARRARTREKFQAELREAEIALLAAELAGLAAQAAACEAEMEPVDRELSETSTAVSALGAEIAALNLNLAQKQEEARVLNETISSTKIEKARLEGLIEGNGRLSEQAHKRMAQLDDDDRSSAKAIGELSPRLEEAGQRLASGEASLKALQENYDRSLAEQEKLQKENADADAASDALKSAITAAYQSEIEVSRQAAETGSNITHHRENILVLGKELEGLERKKNELQGKISGLREKLERGARELADGRARLDGMRSTGAGLAAAFSDIEKKLFDITAGKTGAQSRLDAMLAQGEKDPYWVGINNVLNSGIAGIRGTLRHLLTVKREDRLAVEEAFGRFLDAVVCDTAAAAEEAVAYLKHLGKGRCRFLLLDRAVPVSGSSWEIPNAVKILEKITCPPECDALVSRLLAGVHSAGGSVTGPFWICGGVEEVTSNEPYWEEESGLRDKIRLLGEEETGLAAEKNKTAAGLENSKAGAAALEEKIRALEIEYHRAGVELTNAEGEAAVNADYISLAASQKGKAEADLAAAEERFTELNASLAGIRTAGETKRAEQASLAGRKNLLHEACLKGREDIGRKKADIDNHRKHFERDSEEAARLRNRLSELASERGRDAAEKAEEAERLARNRAETEEAKKRLLEAMSELAEKEVFEKQAAEEVNALKADYDRLSTNLGDSNAILEECEKKKHEIAIRLNTFRTRSSDAGRRLAEEWNIGAEEALAKYASVAVDAERAAFLKKRLENLGPVNMIAPEQYEALANQYNFKKSQMEDLNKARSDLKSAIAKINDTTRENFKATFEKVRTHFRQIYALLFSGGESDLILTMPDDILETGVEILARPPGKKPVSISQLSGGEKALTALALLFSFFCVNPSPFCVMDEADQSLDEANVERYVRLLREFSGATQFIVITHNKRTMECADVLYGVTMEELGVSKLISVDMRKASALAESGGRPRAELRA